ncbi:MAG: hypothetical protein P1P81_11115, partial [Desulfobulbales bacterium]|nr:hypothetical protein [Desulfobulbales bacterium]
MNKNRAVHVVDSSDWRDSVGRLLDAANLLGALGQRRQVLIKPNLVENLQPPITTPVGLVEAIVDYLRQRDKK